MGLRAAVASVVWLAPAVALATPPLHTPYPCGSTYQVTQGHNTGSHTGMGAWAWDIGIGVGGEVASPADGTVRRVRMDSTTGGCSSSYANDANYVVVDFGDGTEALFLHLQAGSTNLQMGDPVKQGDVVGRVGLTGWVCGAHLHFQIQQTCASWWCQSISSTFVDYGDPGYGASLASNNCPVLTACDDVDGTVTVIDERSACFERQTSYWWSEASGYDDHHYFTYAIDAPTSDTVGTWRFDVTTGGDYRVEAHIPAGATTTAAQYFADPGTGRVALGAVDQSQNAGWVELGTLTFTEGDDRYVELGDATGESAQDDRRVTFDAIRLTPVDGGGAGGGAAGGDPSSGAGGIGSGGGAGVGAGLPSQTSTGGNDVDDPGDPDAAAGCACHLDASGSSDGWGWGAFCLLFLLRRRRRS